MTRYVIGPDVAFRMARENTTVAGEHTLLAPTLFRSEFLTLLFHAVHQGGINRKDADLFLEYVRKLRMRLLGDRVLQSTAWKVADQLGWPGTLTAEYLALTQLQADAFITLDPELAAAASKIVSVAPFEALSQAP